MKKLLIFIILFLTMSIPSGVFAQPMPVLSGVEEMGRQLDITSDGYTDREEVEGKEIWEKLKEKQFECKNLTDDNFEFLGEYFMGQMLAPSGAVRMGSSHEAMNMMMQKMMGKEGEEQMHIVMGRRLSGCDTSASYPTSGLGLISMMNLMTEGGVNPMMGYWGNNMMGGWGGLGIPGWVSMLLFWFLIILGVIALIRYLARSGQGKEDKTPLDILKERYAKGEIDKKEFEGKKKDLS